MISPGACVFIYLFLFIFVYLAPKLALSIFLFNILLKDILYSLKKTWIFPDKYVRLNLKLVLISNNYSISPIQFFSNIHYLLISNYYLLTSVLSFFSSNLKSVLIVRPVLKDIIICILSVFLFTYMFAKLVLYKYISTL